MNPKIEKTVREIERTRAKIAELQALLPELEKRRTELENLEIVRLVRSADVAPGDLPVYLRMLRIEHTATEPLAVRESIDEMETIDDDN
jgi:hypothetical protein